MSNVIQFPRVYTMKEIYAMSKEDQERLVEVGFKLNERGTYDLVCWMRSKQDKKQ